MIRKIGSYTCLRSQAVEFDSVERVEIKGVIYADDTKKNCVIGYFGDYDWGIEGRVEWEKDELVSLKQAKKLAIARAKWEIGFSKSRAMSYEARIKKIEKMK